MTRILVDLPLRYIVLNCTKKFWNKTVGTLAVTFSLVLTSNMTVRVFTGSIPPKYHEQVYPSPISVSAMLPPFLFSERQWPRIPLIAISFEVRMVICASSPILKGLSSPSSKSYISASSTFLKLSRKMLFLNYSCITRKPPPFSTSFFISSRPN